MKTLEDIINNISQKSHITKREKQTIKNLWLGKYEDVFNCDFVEMLKFSNIDLDFDMILSDYEACLINKP